MTLVVVVVVSWKVCPKESGTTVSVCKVCPKIAFESKLSGLNVVVFWFDKSILC